MNQQLMALLTHGFGAHQQGQLAEAEHCYQQVLSIQPQQVDALYLLGLLKLQLGDLPNAVAVLDRVVASAPGHVDAHLHLGVAFAQQGKTEQAMLHFSKAKTLAPENPAPYFNMGFTYIGLEKYEAAVVEFENALKLNPTYLEAINNLGNVYHKLGRYQEAVACFKKSLALVPDYPNALLGLSAALCKCEAYEAALDPINRLLQIAPNAYEAHENKGVVLAGLEDYGGAIAEYKKALALNPSAPSETHLKLGLAYTKQKSYAEAFAAYRKALELDPGNSEALISLGAVHAALKQYVDAFAAYREVLLLNPNNPNAYNNLGGLYTELGQNEDALAAFSRALALKPTYQWLPGQLLHMRMKLCDWLNYDQAVSQVLLQIERHQKASTPLPILSFTTSLKLQKICAEIYSNSEYPPKVSRNDPEVHHSKIQVAYLSCDFRNHPVSYLMSGVVAAHDRNRFEIHGIDFGVDDSSATRSRVLNAFDSVHNVLEMSDQDVSELIRRLEIDVLVDLTGHTADARTGIIASRPAPIQVNYLGYPGTMGAAYMDYIVGDATLIPSEYRDGYSEKIAYLPECFQANDISRQIGVNRTRWDVGLDEQAFVFGCFNQCVKFTPEIFAVWMSILKQVPNSVLWLIEDSEAQVKNLKSFAVVQGVSADRLVFAEKLPYAEHLARYALMDLALDTFPFNGGTTTSDALWGGAPVLTYSGETFASRMAASLLNAVGLPELVASSLAAYEAMAVELATQPTKLDALRQRLAINRLTSPLFDTPRFTRHLEAAYEQMVSRSRQGLEPDHIFVPALTA